MIENPEKGALRPSLDAQEAKVLPRNRRLCILFGLGGFIFARLSIEAVLNVNNAVLTAAWTILFFAHAVASILFFLASNISDPHDPKETSGRWSAGCCTLLVLFVCAGFLNRELFENRPVSESRGCAQNLGGLGLKFFTYSKDREDGYYPPLSTRAGNLMPETGDLYPKFLTDLDSLQCPYGPTKHTLNDDDAAELSSALQDRSYIYLGYQIDSPTALRAFEKAYVEIMARGGDFTEDIAVAPGQGTGGGERLLRIRNPQTHGNPELDPRRIPIMIERPAQHKRGRYKKRIECMVLYLDGRVRAKTYPSEWPATPEAMKTLHDLDQMGPHLPPMVPGKVPTLPLGVLYGAVLFTVVRWSPIPWAVAALVYLLAGAGLFAWYTPMPRETTVVMNDGREIVVPVHSYDILRRRTPPW